MPILGSSYSAADKDMMSKIVGKEDMQDINAWAQNVLLNV